MEHICSSCANPLQLAKGGSPEQIAFHKGGGLGMANCAMCGAGYLETTSLDVRWDAEKSQFDLSMTFPRPRGGARDGQLLRDLPQFIVSHSACACGAAVVLKNHSTKVTGDIVEFKGVFQCSVALEHANSTLSKFGTAMSKLWADLGTIEIGPAGLKFGKNKKGADKESPKE
jgi:hypothetical protein